MKNKMPKYPLKREIPEQDPTRKRSWRFTKVMFIVLAFGLLFIRCHEIKETRYRLPDQKQASVKQSIPTGKLVETAVLPKLTANGPCVDPAISITGQEGGVFSPSGFNYVVENASHVCMYWRVTEAPLYLDLSHTSGYLPPGGAVQCTAAVNNVLAGLAVGSYCNNINVFWEPQPGDFTGDGKVNNGDLEFFSHCMSLSGPGLNVAESCSGADLDFDGDVDMDDFGYYQRCISGDAFATRDCTGIAPTVPLPSPATVTPISYSIDRGTWISGTVTETTNSDATYLVVKSTTTGTRYAATDLTMDSIVARAPAKIQGAVIAKSNANGTAQKIYLYNHVTSAWDQVDSTTIGTTEITRTFTVTSGTSQYLKAGQLRVRVEASKSANFRTSYNLVSVTIYP